MAAPDRIELTGLELLLYCGVLPEERIRRQPFRLDLHVCMDLSAAGQSDRLGDTVNYADIVDELAQVLQNERFDLVERAAERVAEIVMAHDTVEGVAVRLHKLRPPVPQRIDSIGVRIERGRTA